MSLADLIRKHDAGSVANAKPAKVANDAAPKSEPLAGLATLALANAPSLETVTARRWQVRYPDLDPMDVIFAPEATRAEVATLYPGARIDALPDDAERPDAPEPVCAPADPFALPSCTDCRNLGQRDRDGFRRCAAAARGELAHIRSKRYAPVPDLGWRCEGYLPRPDDPDRRPGRERWPGLGEQGKAQ